MSGCATCGWPNGPERTPADDCELFGDPSHDSLNCEDCWGICDALCDECGRPVRTSQSGSKDGPDAWTHLPWHWIVPQSITSEGFGWCVECQRTVPVDVPDAPLPPLWREPFDRGTGRSLIVPEPHHVPWFARLRARIFGRSKSAVSGSDARGERL